MKIIEVARSFSYKLSLKHYQNADFFCSRKAEVEEGEEEKVSKKLYHICKKDVMGAVNDFRKLVGLQPEDYLDMKWHKDFMEDETRRDYQHEEEIKEEKGRD